MALPAGSALRDVTTVQLPRDVLVETVEALRHFGRDGNEGFALWIGVVADGVASIRECLIPPQSPIRSEDGVGYFIDGDTLFAINRLLSERRLRLIAQVHSHPTVAYHSSTDDQYAVVTAEGGFSLVVPYFGKGPIDMARWAFYRLHCGAWIEMAARDVDAMFHVAEQAYGADG